MLAASDNIPLLARCGGSVQVFFYLHSVHKGRPMDIGQVKLKGCLASMEMTVKMATWQ